MKTLKTIAEVLSQTPANTFHLQEKRPGLFQLIGPVFHEDGDMMSIFLERVEEDSVKTSFTSAAGPPAKEAYSKQASERRRL